MVNSQYKNNARFSEDVIKLKPLVAAVRWVIASGLLVGSGLTQVSANPASVGAAQLPIPVIPGFSVNTSGNYIIPDTSIAYTITDGNVAAHGSADMTIDMVAQKETINQKTDKAVIDWNSFNIAKGWTVQFKQPNSSSTALNNIHDANATQILGALTANGQVYLVNNNGFVFSKGSTVDANTLVASALNISDETFNAGIIRAFDNNTTTPTAALSGGAATNASIEVQAGASIKAGKSGSVILAAPTVNNSGSISADQQGQILLVASQDAVYLQPASSTSPFAGLLVEVGTGGTVNNNAGGNVSVREGNITLAGFAVNQSGSLSATTSVNVNGSIRLLARENVQVPGGNSLAATQTVRNAGTANEEDASVTFGTGSSTTILADANGGSAIDEQAQKQSYVEVSANKIDMQTGSSIVATAGAVNMLATNVFDIPGSMPTLSAPGNKGRIDLQNGSVIDVSGSTNTTVDMTRNVVGVSVQSFNLRNAPYQRGGILQGQTIQVDVRNLPTIFDASSAVSSIQRGINERLSTGGTIKLTSYGDVVVNTGAVLNISGGAVNYQGGYLNTTQLIDAVTGKSVDISLADPNRQYSGIYGVYSEKHTKWGVTDSWNLISSVKGGRYEAAYTQGSAAGTLDIQSPVLAWDGQLIANAASGIYQRSTPAAGGTFTLNQGDNGGASNLAGMFLSTQDVLFQKTPLAPKTIGINDILDTTTPITFTTDFVNRSGISNLIIKTGGAVTVAQDAHLVMPMLSKLAIDAPVINVLGSIYTPGGTIGLNAVSNPLDVTTGQINLASTAELNVSGRWINDFKDGINQPLAINAGKVNLGKIAGDSSNNLTTSQITFEQGAVIKADGGAQLNLAGNRVVAGNAGSIKLIAGNILFNGPTEANQALSAVGLNQGGALSVTTNKINIGGNDATALNLGVTNGALDLAANAGFKNISLSTIPLFGTDITVDGKTDWTFISKNNVLDANFRNYAGATSLTGFSQLTTLPENNRAPVSLSLTGYTGVTLQTGSQIHVDKGSTVNLSADNAGTGIYVDGLIDAQGGSINLTLKSGSGGDVNPAQAIWLDTHASLNAQGTTLLNPIDALGRQTGTVLNGGSVNVTAERGTVVLANGASINVDGTSAHLNVIVPNALQNNKQVVGSNAGKVNITAAEGIILDGSISAHKGLSTNNGGTLSLTLDRLSTNYTTPQMSPLHIDVQQQASSILTTEVFGNSLDAFNGQAILSSDKINLAGIDNVSLSVPYRVGLTQSPGEIRLLGNVNLNTASSLILDAQNISWLDNGGGTNATINTGYLKIGSSTLDITDPSDVSVLGNGSLIANARNIDLMGSSVMTGFNNVSLNSQHDMRVVGVNIDPTTKSYTGSLSTAATLNLQATQIYPTTLTQFSFNVTDASSQLTITGQNTDVTPLSAMGSLTFNAPIINQNGVIKAPLGNITFNATDTLTFGNGSYTSVSAEGQVIPFGMVLNNVWQYPFDGGNNQVYNSAPDYNSLANKHLIFNAANIQFNQGSVVNVSGGGDLMTAAFQPGAGGGFDYLVAGGNLGSTSNPYDQVMQSLYGYKNGFAILPALGSSLAPYDPYLSATSGLDPRTQVYLSGVPGLAAGFYTELPAYYALLQGAYLVTPQANTLGQSITTYTSNGIPVVSGYETLAGTGIRPSLTNGFLIESSAEVQKHTEYNIQSANQFYISQANTNHTIAPILPQDAGQISINATSQLVLDGQFRVAAPKGARGAKMDISAPAIEVTSGTPLTPTPGILQLSDASLTRLGIDSLLLGGNRTYDKSGATQLDVTADTVTFDAGSTLQVLDLMAVGKSSVNVLAGAAINASGSVNTGDTILKVSGDSAVLRVSADKQVQFNRAYDPTYYTPDMIGLTGDLLIDTGAILSATQSMLLGASHSTVLNGNLSMTGGSINMAANSINLGDVAGLSPTSLNLTNQNLTSLLGNDLTLTSLGAINFYGDVGQVDATTLNLQAIQFKNLVLDAASLSGNTGALLGTNVLSNRAMLKADTLTLQNTSGNQMALVSGTGTGVLDLSATQMNVGIGKIAVDGFSTTNLTADQQLTATGNSVVTVASDLNITAGLMAASGGHNLLIDATAGLGHDVTLSGNGNNTTLVSKALGGSLGFSGNNVTLKGANIQLPSGALKLYSQTGDILLTADANGASSHINLAGETVQFADLTAYTPGGTFSAIAENGSVSLATGSWLDISSGGGKAAGGNLILKALNQNPASELLAGTFKATGASATIDVYGFAAAQPLINVPGQFDTLISQLMTAGVNQSIYIRSRATDIIQEASNTITAKSISLVSDAGSIDIKGKLITDSSSKAGDITLYAAKDITLESGSLLSAKGTTGGHVLLSALGSGTQAGGTISLLTGSTIDVTGSTVGGTVSLNALRNSDPASGINIAPIAGTVTGANHLYAVGFQKYDASITGYNYNVTDASTVLSTDITNYFLSDPANPLYGILSIDPNLAGVIAATVSANLPAANMVTSIDIANLSGFVTTAIDNYMATTYGAGNALSPTDITTISSTITTDMGLYLTKYSADIASLSPTINTDINSYMANAATIEAALGAGIKLRPGIEIDNAGLATDGTGSVTLATAWDFSSLSSGTDPAMSLVTGPIVGDLIVRAAGQLNVLGSLTDGYTNYGSTLMNTDSWSFQLVSGADLSSADTMATTNVTAAEKLAAANYASDPTLGLDPGIYPTIIKDLTIGSGASVHTGTGNIKLASGGNFVLADQYATVYTGGRATVTNPNGTIDNITQGTGSLAGTTLTNGIGGEYPVSGGEVIIQAAGNITGAVSSQFIRKTFYGPAWLGVQGHPLDPNNSNNNYLTAWSINAGLFQQNIGSFGGGQVNIAALGNINDLSVMLPTSGKQLATDYSKSVNTLDIQGAGLMTITAGGDISGGAYFLGQGVANISAGGQINGSHSNDINAFTSGPQLVMSGNQSDQVAGNTELNLYANEGIKISGVSDVMVLQNLQNGTQFFSYTDKSKLNMNTLAGDIHLNSDISVLANILGIDNYSGDVRSEKYLAHVYPASLDATAFNGSVVMDSDIILFPSPVANATILAQQGISSSNSVNTASGLYSFTLSDANTTLLANAMNTVGGSEDPIYSMFNTFTIDSQGQLPSVMHATTPIHAGDSSSARFVTQVGNISSVYLNVSKQAIIQSGNDLLNSSIQIQQNNASDASIISAARDIKFITDLDNNGAPTAANSTYQIAIAGPGNVLVKAGRDIDLGGSIGLTTVGNLYNSALPTTGANLDLLVGLNGGMPDYSAFINKYLVANPLYTTEYLQVTALITPFMQQLTGNSSLSDADALLAFSQLPADQTLPVQPQLNAIITPVFFNELQIAGTASASNKTLGNAGGYAAIDTLYPLDPLHPWTGDLTMPFSKIQTVSGGDINLYVPGGQVNAGLSIAPSGVGAKTSDQLGIVAQAQGGINAFVKNDFTVNTSRVFTLAGGDIEIWSSEGSIDAGKGAKSALSVTIDPPYFDVLTNQLVIPAPKITSGSGIRTAAAPGQTPGNVSLFAPKGIVNAGEAGIAGNNVTISAAAVMGTNNIQVGGVSSGVPQASSGSIAAGLTGVSNLTANVTQVAQASAELDEKSKTSKENMTLGLLSVELLGFGE